MWFQTNICDISFMYIRKLKSNQILNVSVLIKSQFRQPQWYRWIQNDWNYFQSDCTHFQNMIFNQCGPFANEGHWNIRIHAILKYKSNFNFFTYWKSTRKIWECMKNIELQILLDFFQNLLEVHIAYMGMHKKLN